MKIMGLKQLIFGEETEKEHAHVDINKTQTLILIEEQKEHYDSLNDEIQSIRDDNKNLIGEEEYNFVEDEINLLEDTKSLTKKLILKLAESL